MPVAFADADGIVHEIAFRFDRSPKGCVVRCETMKPSYDIVEGQHVDAPITCLECIGWVPPAYMMRCQYCGTWTGTTPYEWATEDICEACAEPIRKDYEEG